MPERSFGMPEPEVSLSRSFISTATSPLASTKPEPRRVGTRRGAGWLRRNLRRANVAQSAALLALGAASTASHADDSFMNSYFQGVPYATSAAYTPGVTLYGTIDEAIGFTKGGKTTYGVTSGGEWTSKFGIYGVEDLGGGLRARFDLESGFNAATGSLATTNTIFNREAWVAIGSRQLGELKFGLQDDVGVPLFVDVFGQVGTVSSVAFLTAWTYDLGPGASFEPSRLPNAVSYSTPWLGPLNAQFAASFNSASVGGPTITTRSTALNYYDGHLFGSLAYVGNYAANALKPTQYVRTDNLAAGVLYDAGNYVLSGGYSFLAPRLAEDRVASLYTFGAIYRFLHRNDVRVELAYRKVAGEENRSFGVTLGYDYNLSMRTALYARISVIHNTGKAASYGVYPSQQPTVDNIDTSYTTASGTQYYQTPHVALVGMYHKF